MKIEEKFVARLSVHSIPVTDARNEETMHGFARRIEATPPGQCALALQLNLLEASALQTCGKCVPCRDGLPQLAKLMRRIVDCEARPAQNTRGIHPLGLGLRHRLRRCADGAREPHPLCRRI